MKLKHFDLSFKRGKTIEVLTQRTGIDDDVNYSCDGHVTGYIRIFSTSFSRRQLWVQFVTQMEKPKDNGEKRYQWETVSLSEKETRLLAKSIQDFLNSGVNNGRNK